MKNHKKHYLRGLFAEWWCCLLLLMKGYRILALRHKTPLGEVDIIARHTNVICFIEVKARPTLEEGIDAVSFLQRDRIARAAQVYLARYHARSSCEVRFDIMVARPWRLPYHMKDAWRPE